MHAPSLQLCLTLCDPMDYSPAGSYVHGHCPGKNTGVGHHASLQVIFPSGGSNPSLLGLLHWQVGSSLLVPPGKPNLSYNKVLNIWCNLLNKVLYWKWEMEWFYGYRMIVSVLILIRWLTGSWVCCHCPASERALGHISLAWEKIKIKNSKHNFYWMVYHFLTVVKSKNLKSGTICA